MTQRAAHLDAGRRAGRSLAHATGSTAARAGPERANEAARLRTRGEHEVDGGYDFSLIRPVSPGAGEPPVPVHARSALAGAAHRRAVTVDGAIHLAGSARDLSTAPLRQLLAHELVHVAQQRRRSPIGDPLEAEAEAHDLAPRVFAGAAPAPAVGAPADRILADTPRDEVVVAQAKSRLKLLETFEQEWYERHIRHLEAGREVEEGLARRTRMAKQGLDPGHKERAEAEEQQVKRVNRLPLDIKVTEDAVQFHVRFQARFEDPASAGRFAELEANLRAGIDLVWNQKLRTGVLEGRRFTLEPEIVAIAANAPRDRRYWLITVRPTNDSPVNYPGCKLDQPPPGDPTSVTDPTCDGGVMSIPPGHVTKPDVLGHELLHLFGLLDRYLIATRPEPGKKPQTYSIPTRETGGRLDPLGGEAGTILAEDLTFLFERYGVYRMEESRGLDTLRSLERTGLTIAVVRAEIEHQKEIIRLGHDPRSLIRLREDFRDKILQDLPP